MLALIIRFRVWLLLLSMAHLISGCSKLEIVYQFADSFVVSKLDHYFDLNRDQKTLAKALAKKEIQRIVRQEIPHLVALLEKFLLLIKKQPLTVFDLNQLDEDTQKFITQAFARLEPSLTPFLLQLSPKQFEYFDRTAKSDASEKQERVKSIDLERKALRKRFEKALDLIGLNLDKTQEKLLDEFVKRHRYPFALEINNQVSLKQQLIKASKSPEILTRFSKKLFSDPFYFRDAEFKLAYDSYKVKSIDFELALLKTLSAQQMKDIESKLQNLIEQLNELKKTHAEVVSLIQFNKKSKYILNFLYSRRDRQNHNC